MANDSILFLRVNREECSRIAEIISLNKTANGQKINYDKSKITFNKDVSIFKKELLKGVLRMKEV